MTTAWAFILCSCWIGFVYTSIACHPIEFCCKIIRYSHCDVKGENFCERSSPVVGLSENWVFKHVMAQQTCTYLKLWLAEWLWEIHKYFVGKLTSLYHLSDRSGPQCTGWCRCLRHFLKLLDLLSAAFLPPQLDASFCEISPAPGVQLPSTQHFRTGESLASSVLAVQRWLKNGIDLRGNCRQYMESVYLLLGRHNNAEGQHCRNSASLKQWIETDQSKPT